MIVYVQLHLQSFPANLDTDITSWTLRLCVYTCGGQSALLPASLSNIHVCVSAYFMT